MQRYVISRTIFNPETGGVVRTLKANYYKMGSRNFLFRSDGFIASCVLSEYSFANSGKKTLLPICVTIDNCVVTLASRYGNMDWSNLIGTQHYPMTAVMVEYDL